MKVKKIKKTFFNFFGVIFAMAWLAALSHSAYALPISGGYGSASGNFASPTSTQTFSQLVCNVTNFISTTALPPVAVLMMLAVGFMFLVSQGDPGKTASAKSALLFTAIGVLLLLLAPGIVAFIASIFDAALPASSACSASAVNGSIVNTLIGLINWFSWFVGVTSVAMGLYGGFLFMTAKDDPAQVKKARGVIAYTIIGIAVSVIAFSIIALVRGFL